MYIDVLVWHATGCSNTESGKLIARVKIRFHAFLISSLDGCALPVSRFGRVFCGKRDHGIDWIGGCLWTYSYPYRELARTGRALRLSVDPIQIKWA
jgi:hypothetical protein